jgi:hypothetical protein
MVKGRHMSDLPKGFVTAGHAALFQDISQSCCDVCAAPMASEAADDEGQAVSGRGLLVWARGEERRYQEPPLCPSCASAIGLSALQRWEIEEEEG